MPLGNQKQTKATSGSRKAVHVGDDQTLYIPVGEVTNLGFSSSVNEIEANSNLDADYSQTIPGRATPIQVTLSYNLVAGGSGQADEGQAYLRARAADKRRFYVRFAPFFAVGHAKFTGYCYVSAISASAPDNGVNSQDVTLSVIGELEESALLGSEVN